MTENTPEHSPASSETPSEFQETTDEHSFLSTVTGRISNRSFTAWYEERQVEQNILEGKSYFNGPSPRKDPERHTPSKLLQCHRKASYARQNAPREGTAPQGLFWIGTEFEEQIIVPYLQAIIPDELYIQNSLWIDTTITCGDTEVHLRGSTDPAIVTSDADPLFITEIKTTTSLDHLSRPKEHHRAQLHAYLYALNEEYEHSICEGLLLYGSRKTLDIKTFHVSFDPDFWQTIVEWMAEQTQFEQADDLPPANPERDWECNYCSFRHRCGEADTPYSDIGHDGLLPLFDEYKRQNLVEYLEGHADAGAKLTPTLAHEYPGLVAEYGAYDWSCPSCSTTYAWDNLEWSGDVENPPKCPECVEAGDLLTLSGPEPEAQH